MHRIVSPTEQSIIEAAERNGKIFSPDERQGGGKSAIEIFLGAKKENAFWILHTNQHIISAQKAVCSRNCTERELFFAVLLELSWLLGRSKSFERNFQLMGKVALAIFLRNFIGN